MPQLTFDMPETSELRPLDKGSDIIEHFVSRKFEKTEIEWEKLICIADDLITLHSM